MSRYIDADVLLLKIDLHGTNKFGMLDEDIREFIRSIPTADVAETLRCKDCKDGMLAWLRLRVPAWL